MLKIIELTPDIAVVEKPIGMPSQSDPTGDVDAMSALSRILSEMGEASDLFLVHRLDRVVGGLMVFARNKKSAAALSELFSSRGAEKTYLAITEGRGEGGELCDLIYKDAVRGKAFVTDKKRAGVKEARLTYRPLGTADTDGGVRTLVEVKLGTGRFHQIRVQFASRGLSLVGDGKYGSHDKRSATPALYAARLRFTLFGRKYEFFCLPDSESYPWSLFDLKEILK